MSGLLAVVPVLDEHWAGMCLGSMTDPELSFGVDPSDILIVDNTRHGMKSTWGCWRYRDPDGHNLGVARSWNLGAQRVLDEERDYLVLVSSSMEFGPLLHTSFVRRMETYWGHNVIEATGHSWHLIALHRRLFETIGLFDPNFYPAYFEQTDWCTRLRIAGLEHGFIHVWINAMSRGVAKGLEHVDCPAGPLLDYYRTKWGGAKGEETFMLPWGTKPMGYFETPTVPEMIERYGLERAW